MFIRFCVALCAVFWLSSAAHARDFFLTIGGGYSPSGNQASLEKNVLFYQRLLTERGFQNSRNDVFFADGSSRGKDLQVVDRDALPAANRLMAEFFGSKKNLGLTYRNHQVANVRGATSPELIRKWFTEVGPTMRSGDRLLLYVTSHGGKSQDNSSKYDTTISLWNNRKIKVSELVSMLDTLPKDITVAAVMVQCHAGGIARFIYNEGNPDKGLSAQKRCGFFATVYDRAAAGCTPEINEASYVEYSTYFWAGIAGRSRTGETIGAPDYDKDGRVSFAEAHAYTVLTANTIDLPIMTSGEFLGIESLFANKDHPDLLPDDAEFDVVLAAATAPEKAILEGLSAQLELTGSDRIADARGQGRQSGRNSRGRRPADPSAQYRARIASDLKRRWPELANVVNPVAVELMTTRSDEFVKAIEGHRDYQRYRQAVEKFTEAPDPAKRKVKFERFVRTAENVILRENLMRLNDADRMAEYNAIVALESQTLESLSSATKPQETLP